MPRSGAAMSRHIRECNAGDFGPMLAIINAAAIAYRGVIPADLWHEPYMTAEELRGQLDAGVCFWGLEIDGVLAGVMGIQRVRDVELIRHAYVSPAHQRHGVGGALIEKLLARGRGRMLVGTWSAAGWAIEFYKRHGFELVDKTRTAELARTYWTIPERQIETSVVLANPPLD